MCFNFLFRYMARDTVGKCFFKGILVDIYRIAFWVTALKRVFECAHVLLNTVEVSLMVYVH